MREKENICHFTDLNVVILLFVQKQVRHTIQNFFVWHNIRVEEIFKSNFNRGLVIEYFDIVVLVIWLE